MKTRVQRLLSILLAAVLAVTLAVAADLPEKAQAATAAETSAAAEERYQKALAAAAQLAEEAASSANGLPTSTTCPMCGKTGITWKEAKGEITTSSQVPYKSSTHNHIYVTGDVTVNASYIDSNNKTAYYYFAASSTKNYYNCIFTNGYDIKNLNTSAFFTGNGKMNVVAVSADGKDHSVIKGHTTGATMGGAVQANGGADTTEGHFYGGIYEKKNASNTSNVIGGSGNSMNIFLYHATVKAGTKGSAIYIPGRLSYGRSVVTLYSGTIDGSDTSDYTVDIEASRAISSYTYKEITRVAQFNMYGGEIIAGEIAAVNMQQTPDTSTTYGANGSVFNMHGGIINSAKMTTGGSGGGVRMDNVCTVTITSTSEKVAAFKGKSYTGTPVFNMTGGTIKGGSVGVTGTTPSEADAKAAFDAKYNEESGNMPADGKSLSVTVYTQDGKKGWGGNCYLSGEVNISGGTIEGGTAYPTYSRTCKVTNKNGEYTYTYSTNRESGNGGNIYSNDATLNITGGTIKDGSSPTGGNIYSTRTLNISGDALIQNGKATVSGGNIHMTGTANINGGTITGGACNESGGNIQVSGTMNITGGLIEKGHAGVTSNGSGGNINVSGTLNVSGGTIRYGLTQGTATAAWGGNIRAWNGNVTISGGLIYGGNGIARDGSRHGTSTQAGRSRNIGVGGATSGKLLTISGGILSSDIYVINSTNYPGTKLVLSGTPQILKEVTTEHGADKDYTASTGLIAAANKGYNAFKDISGLEEGAVIYLATANLDGTVLNENATETLQSCFRTMNADHCICLSGTKLTFETAHTSVNVAEIPATCTTDGKTAGTSCSGCGKVLSGQEAIPAAHTAGEAVQENPVAATCYAEGSYEEVVYCAVEACKAELSREAKTSEKIAHTAGEAVQEKVVAATCYAEGSYDEVVYCSVEACKEELSREAKTSEKIAHTPGAAVKEKEVAASCYAEGSYDEVVYCSVEACKEELSRETKTTEKVAHTPGAAVKENEVAASCYAEGSYDEVVYCSVEGCKAELSREAKTTEKVAHTPGAAVKENEVAASCYAEGSYDEVVYCSVEACKAELSREAKTTEKVAHTPGAAVKENEVAATCYAEGSYDEVVYCSVEACKEELSREAKTSEKIAHTPAEAVTENEVAATCTADGSYESVVYCSVEACKHEISRETTTVTASGHSYTNYIYNNDAKPGVDGTETATCDNLCGATDTRVAEGTALPADAVAEIGGTYYPTIQQALENAAANQVITMLADSDESDKILLVMNNVTLDLNGYTLTAEYLITTSGGANIKDTSNGKGLLKIAKNKLTIVDVEQLPVWIEEDGGFRFAKADMTTYMIEESDNGYAMIGFYLQGSDPDYVVAKELADGAADGDGLVVQVRMSYINDKGTQSVLTFNVPAGVLQSYAANYTVNALTMSINGLNTISNVEFRAVISYGSASVYSNVTSYGAQ